MSRFLRSLFILSISVLLCFVFFACDDESEVNFALQNGSLKGEVYTIYVPSGTESIDLSEYVVVSEDAKWKLFDSSDMEEEIETTVSLQTGDNMFYIRVKDNGAKHNYTVNVVRKRLLTVSFEVNGGSVCSPITVDEGDVLVPPTTSKVGYDFVKWSYDFTQPITEDLTANAEWSAKSFKIFVTWYEGNVQEIPVKFGEDYTISTPNRLGYKFSKLVDADGSEVALSGKYQEIEDLQLGAVYAIENYSITYIYNAEIDNKVVNYTILDAVTLETPVHPNGLEFEGWYSDQQLTNKVTSIPAGTHGDMKLYANWNQQIVPEEQLYNVVIDADGFDFDGNTFSIKYGQTYSLPVVSDINGYDFVGWLANGEIIPTSGQWTVKDDVTLTIKWNAKSYTIQYIIDAKTTNPNTILSFTIETDTIVLLDATRPNATFQGWFDENDQRVTEITKGNFENIVLYAKFEIAASELKYDANGGTVSKNSVTYEKGDSYKLLTPEYPGYRFVGWYNGEDLFEDGVWNSDTDITVVAKWERIIYQITYDLTGGTTTETLKNTYTVEDTFVLPKPTKSGFVFLGWREADGTAIYQDVTITKGTTGEKRYVAVWSMFSYSFSENTATVVSYAYVSNRDKIVIPKTVNYQGVDYTVTEIGASVFAGIGEKIAKKQIVVNGRAVTRVSVEIPNTLQKIGANAFSNCDDVSINVIMESGVELSTWADSLQVAEGNDHVVDVIKGKRPAIGWSVYK